MSVTDVASAADVFWAGINSGDIQGAFSVVDDEAAAWLPAVGVQGGAKDARAYFEETFRAFPDVQFHILRRFTTSDGKAVAEVSMEGTQGADYLGVINQEKHCDVDQAWVLEQTGGRITAIKAYWCQNQLYRRLAVKRLDQISIV